MPGGSSTCRCWRALADEPALAGNEALLAALDEAEQARLVAAPPEEPGRFQFAHALIREVLYREPSTLERLRLHRRVGEALEQLYAAAPEPQLSELAHHFFEAAPAGDADKAVTYCRRAAERAEAQYAFEEAVRLYARALQALDLCRQPDDRVRGALLLALANAHSYTGDFPAMRQALTEAIALNRRTGDWAAIARACALQVRQGLDWLRPDEERLTLMGEVMTALGREHSALRAELLAALASALAFHPARRAEAETLIDEAIATARAAGDHEALAFALARAYLALPDERRQREAASEAVRVADEARLGFWRWIARQWRLNGLLEAGEIRAVDELLGQISRVVAELRSPYWHVFHDISRATRLLLAGRFDDADALVGTMRDRARRFASPNLNAQIGEVRFCLDRERGRLAGMLPGLERGAEQNRNVLIRTMLAFAFADTGRIEDARAVFARLAEDGFREADADRFRRMVLALLAETCAALDDRERAETLYRLLLPLHGGTACHGDCMFMGATARHLGLLATVLGNWPDAERHLADALAMNARMGARPWVAWTQLAWARLCLARRQPGDAARAIEHLDAALADAEELGMARLLDAASTMRAEAEAAVRQQRPAAPVLPAGLSEREVEVLRLVASGKSNREIAEILVLSVNTVNRHVSHIFEKTGAQNRAEATAFALRQGLA